MEYSLVLLLASHKLVGAPFYCLFHYLDTVAHHPPSGIDKDYGEAYHYSHNHKAQDHGLLVELAERAVYDLFGGAHQYNHLLIHYIEGVPGHQGAVGMPETIHNLEFPVARHLGKYILHRETVGVYTPLQIHIVDVATYVIRIYVHYYSALLVQEKLIAGKTQAGNKAVLLYYTANIDSHADYTSLPAIAPDRNQLDHQLHILCYVQRWHIVKAACYPALIFLYISKDKFLGRLPLIAYGEAAVADIALLIHHYKGGNFLLAGLHQLEEAVGHFPLPGKKIPAVELDYIDVIEDGIKVVLDSLSCHPNLQYLLVLVYILITNFGPVVDHYCAQEEKKQNKESRSYEVYDYPPWEKGVSYSMGILLHTKKFKPELKEFQAKKKSLLARRDPKNSKVVSI